jgi:hypothetical protein
MARLNDLQGSIEKLDASIAQLIAMTVGDTARNDESAKGQAINQVLWSGTLSLKADGTAVIEVGATVGSALIVNHTGNALWVWAGEGDSTVPTPGKGRHLVRPNTDLRAHMAGSTISFSGTPGGTVGVQLFTGRTEL